MDLTTDGFGFMLSVGDLTWVPFTYCYSARYVALHPNDLGYLGTAAILAVQLVGYWCVVASMGVGAPCGADVSTHPGFSAEATPRRMILDRV